MALKPSSYKPVTSSLPEMKDVVGASTLCKGRVRDGICSPRISFLQVRVIVGDAGLCGFAVVACATSVKRCYHPLFVERSAVEATRQTE